MKDVVDSPNSNVTSLSTAKLTSALDFVLVPFGVVESVSSIGFAGLRKEVLLRRRFFLEFSLCLLPVAID